MKVKSLHWDETIDVRHKVLWPNKTPEYCIVEGDEDALHFGVFIENKLVCVASIYVDGKSARLRKFATLIEFQGKGIGSFMIKFLLAKLKELEISFFWFDARESATEFYKKFGFTIEGERFYKEDIPYYKMFKKL